LSYRHVGPWRRRFKPVRDRIFAGGRPRRGAPVKRPVCSRGTSMATRSRDASAPELCQRNVGWAKARKRRAHAYDRRGFNRVGFASLRPPYKTSKNNRKRNADRRRWPLSAPAGAARATEKSACADPPLRARSPVGVPPWHLRRRTNAPAQLKNALPGTWSERATPIFRKTARLLRGRYPRLPVPVQRRGRRPVIVPAGRFPRTARERR
jgi:hypothetical protein